MVGPPSAIAGAISAARARGNTLDCDDFVIDDGAAYEVQRLRTAERLARGERVRGWKLGYTSAAMRAAMGIDRRNYGPLTDRMILASPARAAAPLTQPLVEPEIAVRIGADGEIAARRLALEVVDSVWSGYRFTWAHNTADESSAALAVVDESTPLPTDLARARVVLVSSTGESAEADLDSALPDLVEAVDWLAHQLAQVGAALEEDAIVLTGGLTRPLALPPQGWVAATLEVPHDGGESGDIVADVRVERP